MTSARELSRQLRARQVSARKTLDLHKDVIARRNSGLNAIVAFSLQFAGARADGESLGLLP
jgi:Asp-tRNA(Asn)/Glu-tRNA(Gln) amidotransferase A subunit family amidase